MSVDFQICISVTFMYVYLFVGIKQFSKWRTNSVNASKFCCVYLHILLKNRAVKLRFGPGRENILL